MAISWLPYAGGRPSRDDAPWQNRRAASLSLPLLVRPPAPPLRPEAALPSFLGGGAGPGPPPRPAPPRARLCKPGSTPAAHISAARPPWDSYTDIGSAAGG